MRKIIAIEKLDELVDTLIHYPENELDINILKLKEKDDGWTVAHELARRGYRFTRYSILRIKDKFGWSVAHEVVRQGYNLPFDDLLYLEDSTGWKVADELRRVKLMEAEE